MTRSTWAWVLDGCWCPESAVDQAQEGKDVEGGWGIQVSFKPKMCENACPCARDHMLHPRAHD